MHIFGCTMSLEFSDELLARLGLADAEKPETLRGLSYRAKISLGLADAEKPETFAELAGPAERYMALPAADAPRHGVRRGRARRLAAVLSVLHDPLLSGAVRGRERRDGL